MNEMLKTAQSAGINIMGKHKAAKLLALCYAFTDESFVFDKRLHNDVQTAAYVCGIGSMRTPDMEAVKLINSYLHDLQNGAGWVSEINSEYRTNFKNQMETDGRDRLKWPYTHT